MVPIFQFLEGRRTSDKPTHLSMIDPKGKFQIQGKDLDDFMDLYCSQSPDEKFGLLEATSILPVLPVLVDADVKLEMEERPENVQPLYNSDMMLKLVRVYQEVLKQIVNGVVEEDLLCIVLTKDPYVLQNEKTGKWYFKNGFHLQFPRCFLSKKNQMNELIPRVKLEWKRQVAVSEYSLSIDQMIDKSYCRGTPWLLYRSCKALDMEPYLINFVVDGEGIVQDNWRPLLMDMQMLRHDRSKIELDFTNIDFHLPRILSVSPLGREHYIYELVEDLEPLVSSSSSQKPKMKTNLGEQGTKLQLEQLKPMVDELLSLLSDTRAEERNDWIMVGWVLYNIFNGKEEGLESWIRFSQRSPANFSLSVCRNEWNRMTKRDVTIGTLKYMAKTDNPKQYNEIMTKYMQPFYEKAMKLSGSHNDLAKALFAKYEHQFVCASIREKLWFEYANHAWNRVEDGYTLRMKISEEIVKSYESLMQELSTKCTQADEDEQPMINKKLKNCIRIVSALKQAPYKSNIMKECMEVFYQPTFLKDMDNNPFLFAFNNGVYDLHQHKFREGRPFDKNSIKSPINYRQDFSMDHPEVQEVFDFFEKIFPNPEVKEWFYDVSAQVFIGGNHAKIFQVWTGEGDNGKSVTQSLFEKMLGSYSIKLPTSLIVGKRTQSSSACPELVRAGNGVRMAVLQEPDANDTINVGILKELSGNDTFFARGLYKEGTEITPMFKLILICNETPHLGDDKAAWNRVRVIPFDSRFVNAEQVPPDPNEQLRLKTFLKDTTLGDRIGNMAEAFAWFLIEHLKRHPKIRPEPSRVMEATDKFRDQSNMFRIFSSEHILPNPDGFFNQQAGWEQFQEWCNFGNYSKRLNITDFRKGITRIYGEPEFIDGQYFWKGYSLRSQLKNNNPSILITSEPTVDVSEPEQQPLFETESQEEVEESQEEIKESQEEIKEKVEDD